jgi:regulatory protein
VFPFCYSSPETAVPFKRPKQTFDENALYDYAVAALGRRMRSVAELKRLMRNRCPEETIIDKVITRLKDQKYLNDSSYAAAYTAFRRDNEKFGPRRVITDLKIKGVHGDVIEKAIEEGFSVVNEEDQARAFLRRKRIAKPENDRQAARVFRALMRAGFRTAVAIKLLKNWQVEDEVLSALQEEDENEPGGE